MVNQGKACRKKARLHAAMTRRPDAAGFACLLCDNEVKAIDDLRSEQRFKQRGASFDQQVLDAPLSEDGKGAVQAGTTVAADADQLNAAGQIELLFWDGDDGCRTGLRQDRNRVGQASPASLVSGQNNAQWPPILEPLERNSRRDERRRTPAR